MKKLITLCLITAMAFTAKAQNLSFEETVTYIREALTDNQTFYWQAESSTGYLIKNIKAKNTGKVAFYKGNNEGGEILIGTLNLLDVKEIEIKQYLRTFFQFESDNGEIGQITDLDINTANKLKKAFLHLKSLCKNDDPFAD